MGVEYAHYLLARDPNWIGSVDVARRVRSMLDRRGLASGEPELFGLEGGRRRKLRGRLATSKALPANLLVRYPHVNGGRAVAEVVGPSYYAAVGEDERYFQGISVVVGTDFRVGPCSESLSIEVIRLPTRAGRDVIPYSKGSCLWEFDDSYPADESALPPATRIEAHGELPAGFTGVWRAGLMLDCGKDLPRIDDFGFGLRLSDRFAAELADAFGTHLVEVGRVH
ncbi:unnamed protein product [Gemmata massiliana]|uniref:Uncharacterized protein n=1 Tax=Gemmata massiliana TaxID=1210884 RepID=A0A6P2DHF4_9BACT|nr:hypothetical protein [Gemmata massiliana]VTS01372.1 unnamed protein product [Gemmata massiliana]